MPINRQSLFQTGGIYAAHAPRFGSSPAMMAGMPMIGAAPQAQAPASIAPAQPMPTGTNLSSYFAPETPDAMTGSGIQGAPFQMGPGTAWPFSMSWGSILGTD
jgi:hypothetical protein